MVWFWLAVGFLATILIFRKTFLVGLLILGLCWVYMHSIGEVVFRVQLALLRRRS